MDQKAVKEGPVLTLTIALPPQLLRSTRFDPSFSPPDVTCQRNVSKMAGVVFSFKTIVPSDTPREREGPVVVPDGHGRGWRESLLEVWSQSVALRQRGIWPKLRGFSTAQLRICHDIQQSGVRTTRKLSL